MMILGRGAFSSFFSLPTPSPSGTARWLTHLGLPLLVLLVHGFWPLLGLLQLLMANLRGHLALHLLELQPFQELGLHQQLPVQCLLVGGQLLVSCQVLLIYSHLLLQVGQALVLLFLQTPSSWLLTSIISCKLDESILQLGQLLLELVVLQEHTAGCGSVIVHSF
jgi:hypothetical protein